MQTSRHAAMRSHCKSCSCTQHYRSVARIMRADGRHAHPRPLHELTRRPESSMQMHRQSMTGPWIAASRIRQPRSCWHFCHRYLSRTQCGLSTVVPWRSVKLNLRTCLTFEEPNRWEMRSESACGCGLVCCTEHSLNGTSGEL